MSKRKRQTKRKLGIIVGVHLFLILITAEIVLMCPITCPQSFIKGRETQRAREREREC